MSYFSIVSETQRDGLLVVKAAGMLDVFTFPAFKKYFKTLCQRTQTSMVVVDLGAIELIASSGWSVLLATRQALVRQGGDMSIFAMHENLRRVYDTMKIQTLLPVGGNLAEAEGLLRAHEPVKPELQAPSEAAHGERRRTQAHKEELFGQS